MLCNFAVRTEFYFFSLTKSWKAREKVCITSLSSILLAVKINVSAKRKMTIRSCFKFLQLANCTHLKYEPINEPLYWSVAITEGFQPSQNIIEKWWIYSFVYLLATKPTNKWSKASGQSSEGLWVENRAEIWVFFFHLFQNCSIFQPFLFLCLFVN